MIVGLDGPSEGEILMNGDKIIKPSGEPGFVFQARSTPKKYNLTLLGHDPLGRCDFTAVDVLYPGT